MLRSLFAVIAILVFAAPVAADEGQNIPVQAGRGSAPGGSESQPRVGHEDTFPPQQANPDHGLAATEDNTIHGASWGRNAGGSGYIRFTTVCASYYAEGEVLSHPSAGNPGVRVVCGDGVYCSDAPKFTASAPGKFIIIFVQNTILADASGSVPPHQGSKINAKVWSLDIKGKLHQNRIHIPAGSTTTRTVADSIEESSRTTDSSGIGVSGGGGGGLGVGVDIHSEESSEENTSERTEHGSGESGTSGSSSGKLYEAVVSDFATGTDSATWGPRKISSGGRAVIVAKSNGSSDALTDIWVDVSNIVGALAYAWPTDPGVRDPQDPNPPPYTVTPLVTLGNPTTLPGTGLAATVAVCEEALGLSSETGSLPGLAAIRLDDTAGNAIQFLISCFPSGRLSFPEGTTITIPPGKAAAAIRYIAETVGNATVELTLLDSQGQPTTTSLFFNPVTQSTSSIQNPELSALMIGDFDEAGEIIAPPGGSAGYLLVTRTGFSGFATTSTSLTLGVTDPQGILSSFPSSIVIDAGDTQASLEVMLTSAAGTASIDVLDGTEVIETIVIHSKAHAFVATGDVRIPLNAKRGYIQFEVETAASQDRTYAVMSDTPSVATMPTGLVTLAKEQHLAVAQVAPVAIGTTTITVTSPALTSMELDVSVVAAEVSLGTTELQISNLDNSISGVFTLGLPGGAVFSSVQETTGASNVVLKGIGTSVLRIEVAADPAMGTSLDFDVILSGSPTEVSVFDRYHDVEWAFPYVIDID